MNFFIPQITPHLSGDMEHLYTFHKQYTIRSYTMNKNARSRMESCNSATTGISAACNQLVASPTCISSFEPFLITLLLQFFGVFS